MIQNKRRKMILWTYIKDNDKQEYIFIYDDIKNILGFNIDHAFLTYKKELIEYGYEVLKISLKDKMVMIKKVL
ncbi:MAG: hypothetical protein Q4C38_02815 [bacterium]|nr:hypothetical protein [bacterium]